MRDMAIMEASVSASVRLVPRIIRPDLDMTLHINHLRQRAMAAAHALHHG
jgi:hypothetical protein